MNNSEIIFNEAIASGRYTEEQLLDILNEGGDIPFHTFSYFRVNYNMVPKAGEHGWETRLWRKKNRNCEVSESDANEEQRKRDFFLCKAFLFDISQCVPITPDVPPYP